jgi:hypothetical protein
MNEQLEKIREALIKRNMYVLSENSDYTTVVWDDGNKTKVGQMSKDYAHRYGVSTIATYNGRTWWFQSGEVADNFSDADIELTEDFWHDSTFTVDIALKPFDVGSIKISW